MTTLSGDYNLESFWIAVPKPKFRPKGYPSGVLAICCLTKQAAVRQVERRTSGKHAEWDIVEVAAWRKEEGVAGGTP